MSNNRVIMDSFGRQFSCDSMERFGDDLCELILSYLLSEDCHRLQCVSKQWQRLIYNKKSTLVVTKWKKEDLKCITFKIDTDDHGNIRDHYYVNRLKSLL